MATELAKWDQPYVDMMSTLKRYVGQLQNAQPLDTYGRPTSLVNPQALLATGFRTPIDDLLDNPPEGAVLPISYLEGLPTIEGIPIWEHMDGEPIEFYGLFKRYRNMRTTKESRAVFKLAAEVGSAVKHVEIIRQAYHWQARVTAYDNYVEQERQEQLELRRAEIEHRHATTAEQLYRISSKYLLEHEDLLTPKVAMQMLDVAVKLERASTGMASMEGRGAPRQILNIQNNVGAVSGGSGEAPQLVTGKLEEDKTRLSQVLNVMNKLGLIEPEAEVEIVEAEVIDDGSQH